MEDLYLKECMIGSCGTLCEHDQYRWTSYNIRVKPKEEKVVQFQGLDNHIYNQLYSAMNVGFMPCILI